MSSFPNSPRLIKGGITLIAPHTAAVLRIIALQYNPDTLTRSLQIKGVGESADRSEALRLKGPPVETIKIEAEIDAIDQRHLLQSRVITELTRLLTDRALAPSLAQGIALPRMSTSGIQLTDSNNPRQIGQQIARSVY